MPNSHERSVYALVTGASTGLGSQLARQLAAMDTNLVLASRNLDGLETMRAEIAASHDVEVVIIQCDLSIQGAAQELYQTCRSRRIEIDILINNAGQGMSGAAVDQDAKGIEHMLVLNAVSPTTLSSLFARDMKQRGTGYIMNIGSLAGNQPTPFFGSYAASKGYLHDYTVALSYELRGTGVSATCFVAGYVKTEFDKNAHITSQRYLEFSNSNAQSATEVADMALRAMFKRKMIAHAGGRNALVALVSRLLPMRMKSSAIRWIMLRIIT